MVDDIHWEYIEEDCENFIEQSNNKIKRWQAGSNDKTYCGISINNWNKVIECGSTEIMKWDHLSLKLKTLHLTDTSGDKVRELKIPEEVEEIYGAGEGTEDGKVLGYNDSLRVAIKKIVIPSSVIVINANTFAMNTRLTKVVIENNSRLMYLGAGAFSGCINLRGIDLRNCIELERIPNDIIADSGVEVLKFNKNIKEIAKGAFRDSRLKKIVVGDYKYEAEEFIEYLKNNNWKNFWSY